MDITFVYKHWINHWLSLILYRRKEIKILPEDTERVICDICSAFLNSQIGLDHYEKYVHTSHHFSDKYLSGPSLYCYVTTAHVQ